MEPKSKMVITLKEEEKLKLTVFAAQFLEKANEEFNSKFSRIDLSKGAKELDSFLHETFAKKMWEEYKNSEYATHNVKFQALYSKLGVTDFQEAIFDNIGEQAGVELLTKHAPDLWKAMKVRCFLDVLESGEKSKTVFDTINTGSVISVYLNNGEEITLGKHSSPQEATAFFQKQFEDCHENHPTTTKYDGFIEEFKAEVLHKAKEYADSHYHLKEDL